MHNTAVTAPDKPSATAELGVALEELGQLPKSRTGRLLIRGALVGFLLVFTWIFAIVYLQWREHRRPDFRSLVESQLTLVKSHRYQELYDSASPRFQELVRFETFSDRLQEIEQSVGAFRELSSIDSAETSRGPRGLTSYITMRLRYDKGMCPATMSFHRTGGQWRLLQLTVSLPPDIAKHETTAARRKERSAAPPEVRAAAERSLGLLRDKKYQEVWQEGSPLFQQSITVAELAAVEKEHFQALGRFVRLIQATATQTPAGTSATLDGLAEYQHATARISLGFNRAGVSAWQLNSYQLVLPMPRILREVQPTDEELLRETLPKR